MDHLAEEIERAALVDLHKAASSDLRTSLGIFGQALGSAFVSVASTLPASAIVLNRTIGVGLRKPETEETIHEIVDAYQSANVSRYFIQLHPDAAPSTIETWLLERGVEKARGWQKFSRGRESIPPPKTDLTINEDRG
jgi:hypothetical protein